MSKYTLGGMEFPHKKDAEAYVRYILHSHKLKEGESWVVEDPTAKNVLIALFESHPGLEHKIPEGRGNIEKVFIQRERKMDQFWVKLKNGRAVVMSYQKCFMASPKTYYKKCVTDAFRALIGVQCAEYKTDMLKGAPVGQCAYSGKWFPAEELEVDHASPAFSEMVSNFMKERGLKFQDIEVEYSDKTCVNEIKDLELKKAFWDYHKKNAVLVLIHKELNSTLKTMSRSGELFNAVVKQFSDTHAGVAPWNAK